jgi:DNA end-binding protein Ku
MPHALWTGTISFGLVNIPVSVVSAVNREETLDFDLIDKRDHAHVGYQKINKSSGRPIEDRFIVKGLKLNSGKYVMFDPKELSKFRIKGNNNFEIQQFVDRDEVSPLYFENPYYLIPGKNGAKTYVLLHDALADTKKFAVGYIVLHTKKRLALVGAENQALVLYVIRYAANLRKPEYYEIPTTKSRTIHLAPREKEMAEELVEGLSSPWKPEQFKNTYQMDIMAAVKRKSKTTVEEAPRAAKETNLGQVLDLMPLLEESLKSTSRSKKAPAKTHRRKPEHKRAG